MGDAALIVGDTGWVVPPSNSEQLFEAITKALNEKQTNADAWNARQQAARQRIEDNFSIETMVGKYHRVWVQN